MLHNLLINNLIHDLETFDRLLFCDSNIRLLQRYWAETEKAARIIIKQLDIEGIKEVNDRISCNPINQHVPIIKIEESFSRINTEECSYILIVGQRGTKPHQPHIFLSHLYVTDGTGN